MVPLPEGPDEPTEIWPPIRNEWPDLSGKTLALACVYVSRHVAKWAWVVIDHDKAKEAAKAAFDKIKDKLPAGGIAGRPPQTRPPGT